LQCRSEKVSEKGCQFKKEGAVFEGNKGRSKGAHEAEKKGFPYMMTKGGTAGKGSSAAEKKNLALKGKNRRKKISMWNHRKHLSKMTDFKVLVKKEKKFFSIVRLEKGSVARYEKETQEKGA